MTNVYEMHRWRDERRLRPAGAMLRRNPQPPDGGRAIIYQRGRSAMQAGRRGADEWILEFEPGERQVLDPLMGWPGSGDTRAQVSLRFANLEQAVEFARRNRMPFQVLGPSIGPGPDAA